MRPQPALLDPDLARLRVTTPAGTFDAVATGPAAGRGVLLLHGASRRGAGWRRQLRALAAHGYRAVAPDLRGYSPGVRPRQGSAYGLDHVAQDVVEIADALGWRRFDLVGNGWGAIAAWVVASGFPLRVRSLTAVSGPHPGALAHALRTDLDQRRRWYRQDLEPAGRDWRRANDFSGVFRPVAAPTRYLWGQDDAVVSAGTAQLTARWTTGPYWFEAMPDVGHLVPEEAAEETALHLLDHLSAY